jgi:hypothetical protein
MNAVVTFAVSRELKPGHDFEFFWQPLASEPSEDWHPVHAAALRYLRGVLTGQAQRS